jgi:hypothetical protein
MPVAPVLRLRQLEDHGVEASLGYTARPCLRKQKQPKHFSVV